MKRGRRQVHVVQRQIIGLEREPTEPTRVAALPYLGESSAAYRATSPSATLGVGGRRHRLARARERNEERVALRVDLAAAGSGEGVTH